MCAAFDPRQFNRLNDYIDALRAYEFNRGYQPLHAGLYRYASLPDQSKQQFQQEIIHPDLYYAKRSGEWRWVLSEPIYEVYQFPLLRPDFCRTLIEEAEHFDHWLGVHIGPNEKDYHPTTDVRLASMPGFDNANEKPVNELYVDLLRKYVGPIIDHVWSYQVKLWRWSFIARYTPGEQPFLGFHHDDCTCACVVALNESGKEYQGGGTFFEKFAFVDEKPIGYATIHPSKLTHRHGAARVTSGTRYALNTFID